MCQCRGVLPYRGDHQLAERRCLFSVMSGPAAAGSLCVDCAAVGIGGRRDAVTRCAALFVRMPDGVCGEVSRPPSPVFVCWLSAAPVSVLCAVSVRALSSGPPVGAAGRSAWSPSPAGRRCALEPGGSVGASVLQRSDQCPQAACPRSLRLGRSAGGRRAVCVRVCAYGGQRRRQSAGGMT